MTRIDQLNTQEQNAQAQYNAELSDYYSQLDRKGSAYNAAYEQDYGRYQDYLGRLDTLYGYYSNQEQQAIAKRTPSLRSFILKAIRQRKAALFVWRRKSSQGNRLSPLSSSFWLSCASSSSKRIPDSWALSAPSF